MRVDSKKPSSTLPALPDISLRHLEAFSTVCHEMSYTNAALELDSTRTAVKRTCEDFTRVVGRPLFTETADRRLQPTEFASGLLQRMSPLSRAMRALEDAVKSLHHNGRLLRCAAAGDLLLCGCFSDYLKLLQKRGVFRPCFQRIDERKYRNALLNAECDVYFGIGLTANDRLDLLELGLMPWKILAPGRRLPENPGELCSDWWLRSYGDEEAGRQLLEDFRSLGARGGALIAPEAPAPDGILFEVDLSQPLAAVSGAVWPGYRFAAALRKQHPYHELRTFLAPA